MNITTEPIDYIKTICPTNLFTIRLEIAGKPILYKIKKGWAHIYREDGNKLIQLPGKYQPELLGLTADET